MFSTKTTDIGSSNSFQTDQKTFLHIACSDFYLSISALQLEGKKKMTIEEFLRGTKIESVA